MDHATDCLLSIDLSCKGPPVSRETDKVRWPSVGARLSLMDSPVAVSNLKGETLDSMPKGPRLQPRLIIEEGRGPSGSRADRRFFVVYFSLLALFRFFYLRYTHVPRSGGDITVGFSPVRCPRRVTRPGFFLVLSDHCSSFRILASSSARNPRIASRRAWLLGIAPRHHAGP